MYHPPFPLSPMIDYRRCPPPHAHTPNPKCVICCRYMYNESLGRWRMADLLIGLAYLARQESANMAVADIAAAGRLVGQGKSQEERQAVVVPPTTSSFSMLTPCQRFFCWVFEFAAN